MQKDRIAIISPKTEGYICLFNEIKNTCFELNIYENISEVINHIENMKLILIDTIVGFDESIRIIKELKPFVINSLGIVVVIREDKIKDVKGYIEAGANDYILDQFTFEELEIKLLIQSSLTREREDSKIKSIQLESILDNKLNILWFKDRESKFINVNKGFEEYYGISRSDVIGKSDEDIWDGDIVNEWKSDDLKVMKEKQQMVFSDVVQGKYGYKKFNVYKSVVFNKSGEVVGTMGIASDITELVNKESKLQMLMDNLPFQVSLCDVNGVYINANKQVADYFNTTANEIIGKDANYLYDDDFAKLVNEENRAVIKNRETMKFEAKVENKLGTRYVEVYKTPVFGIANEVIGVASAVMDVTDYKEAQNIIKKQAFTDSLTQIANRRALYEYVEEEKDFSKIGMMLIDIDNFKAINDFYGHHFGDRVIKYVVGKLKEVCHDDFVCRLGGDEFLVVFKNVEDKKEICAKAELLLKKANSNGDKYELDFSASIGVAIGDEKDSIDRMLVKIDIAMYKAKELGKNQFVFYSKEIEEEKNLALKKAMSLTKTIKNY